LFFFHLAIQADDTKLICGSADKSIYCWDLRTRKLLWQSSVNRGWIGGVMFDCSKVISCSSGSFPVLGTRHAGHRAHTTRTALTPRV
jgi:WD40 repeat protein